MKKFILSALTIAFLATGCSKDEEFVPSINASDFTKKVDENLAANTEIGTLTATGNDGAITYSLVSQTPSGAIAVSNDGKITVADATKFDFETNPKIEATVKAKSANTSKDIKVSINLNDVDDLLAFLSTSKTKYKNAATNDWVEITKAEYDNLATKLNQTTKVGLSDNDYEGDHTKLRSGARGYTVASYGTPVLKIPNNAYFIAFRYVSQASGARTTDQVKISSNSNKYLGYSNLGKPLPSHSGLGEHFFIIKNNTVKNSAKGHMAFYSSESMGHKSSITGVKNAYKRGNQNTLGGGENIIYQAQGIATTQKQW